MINSVSMVLSPWLILLLFLVVLVVFAIIFEHLLFEKTGVEVFGLRVFVGVGIHPRCIPSGDLKGFLGVVEEYLGVADVLGEVGLETGSDTEVRVLEERLKLAKRLDKLVIIHTPRINKYIMLEKVMDVIDRLDVLGKPVLIDHLIPLVLVY